MKIASISWMESTQCTTKMACSMDGQDRDALRDKLELCIDPLDPGQHPSGGLVYIVTGMVVTHPSVNVDDAVQLGHTQMESFKTWSEGFHDTIHKVVNTLSFSRRHLKLEKVKVFDTENVLAHELAPYPMSMFDVDRHMREAKTKSTLKSTLKVDISSHTAERDIDATFLDGCAVLWVIPWSTSGTVQDYLDKFCSYLLKCMKSLDVYLVFDR